MKRLPLIFALLLIGCGNTTPPVSRGGLDAAGSNGGAFADVAALGRFFGQIKVTSHEPAVLAIADAGIETSFDATSKIEATSKALALTQKEIAAANARATKAEADRNSALQTKAWLLALGGIIAAAGSVFVSKFSIGWGKTVGKFGIILALGGSVLALVVPTASIVLTCVLVAIGVMVVSSLGYQLVKSGGNLAEVWKRNQLTDEVTSYSPSTAAAIKSAVGVSVPVLPTIVTPSVGQ